MKRIFLILLLLALSSGVSRAQEPGAEPVAEPETAAVPESTAADESADEESAADSEASPFDYESSEQISEDLSVSFPVDI